MNKKHKYTIPAGLGMFAGTILAGEAPSSSTLRDMIVAYATDDDLSSDCPGGLNGLVNAYIAMLEFEEASFELVTGEDIEPLHNEVMVKGYRSVMKRERPGEKFSADDILEACSWFDDTCKAWPLQLLVEVGYLRGVTCARESVMRSHFYRNAVGR